MKFIYLKKPLLFRFSVLIVLMANSCVLIPFTDPDSQARGEVDIGACASTSCPKRSQPRIHNYSRQDQDKDLKKLLALLNSKSDAVRTNASTDLGNLGSKAISAVPSLETLAKKDSSKWVRRSAVKALQKIGSPSSLAVLKTVSKNDSNIFVRESASNALIKMKTSTVRGQLK